MTDDILGYDSIHAGRMERGSSWLHRAILRARSEQPNDPRALFASYGGGDLIWNYPTQSLGIAIGSRSYHRAEAARQRMEERDRQAEARRVKRDPCPYCGVRADIGCHHSRRAA